ncbi:MAG: transglycosylase SLT domain-containing protein [Candidatus Competibacteraceae bacterium]
MTPATGAHQSSWWRPLQRWSALLVIIGLAAGVSGDVSAEESLQAWREAFKAADQSLQNGSPVDYASLHAYPLYPYLRYRALSHQLPESPAADIRDFLQAYADSPLASRLRTAWLRQLATAQHWEDFLHDVQPTSDLALECWRRQALLNTGQRETALRDFANFWSRGVSLPTACDPVITAWRTQGEPTPERLWRRFALAIDNNNLGLAKALREGMPAADQTLADTWLAVADKPQLLLESNRFNADDPRTAALLSDGLERWGKHDAPGAATALDTLKERYPQFRASLSEVERLLALWIASDYHPTALTRLTALPEAAVDSAVREWRVRVSLRQGDWTAARRWLNQLTEPERDSPRWQYWRGRVLEALGQIEDARQAYQHIASQRDYYGFLAADRLAAPYAIANTPLAIPATELDALLTGSPGLQRARELYILGRTSEADAEWQQASRNFGREKLQQAALLAHHWEWHHQAIVTLARAEYWDDLGLRFPLAYQDGVVANARADTLDPAWVYAVIRQESSFRPDARSPVGALGLMQIMPATGQQIAQELQDKSAGNPELLQADLNIRYGVHYLRRILGQLQDNPLLATAAYNAGPNQVAKWLPERDPVPADVWVETIPYRETRLYVQRVMEYTAIYSRRLGLPGPDTTLNTRMKAVLPMQSIKRAG